MGLFDKVKKILFDEDEVEVPVEGNELPEREPKKYDNKKSVIEDHNGDKEDEVSEDTIVEIKLPVEEDEVPKKSFKFDVDLDDDLPVRTRSNESLDEVPTHEAFDRDVLRERDRRIEEEFAKRRINTETKVEKTPGEEVKDYKKILEEKPSESTMKKPFRVTPVISPVFGYVDPEYVDNSVINEPMIRKEPVRTNPVPRDFGPVSYNDAPIPVKTKIIKEDIVELNTAITDLEKEEVPAVVKKTTVVETEIIMPEKKEEIPDVETSGIEDDYLNNGIEDAFESTSEFDKVRENDEVIENTPEEDEFIPGYEDESIFEDTQELEPSYVSEYDDDFEATAPINLDELDSVTKTIKESKEDKNEMASQLEEEIEEEYEEEVHEEETKAKKVKKTEPEDDDENLDETIETDLFNLIDSMYKSDDDDEDEEEE